ncbi:MAG: amino acid ABC transporter permease [Actinomycetota bacterium]|nr:amino acid ABC transporter permease [Actinomycetota bacterium]
MSSVLDMWPFLVDGFAITLKLLVASALITTLLGTVLAAMRVSPVVPFRAFGTAYVTVFRNTPLVVLFILVVEGFPPIGVTPSIPWLGMNDFQTLAVLALSTYTAAFVCEALRAGINTVDAGQAEAARTVGMTFGQSLRMIVLPQAFRAVIPPLASVYIALTKNTSVAAVFGVTEATYQLRRMIEQTIATATVAFLGIAAGYVLIVWVIAGTSAFLERQVSAAR